MAQNRRTMKPSEIAEIGRQIAHQEQQAMLILKYEWWESYQGQSEEELLECLCKMTELWGIIQDEERSNDI